MTWNPDLPEPRKCEECGAVFQPRNNSYAAKNQKVCFRKKCKRKRNNRITRKHRADKKIKRKNISKDIPKSNDLWQCQDPLNIGCKTWSNQRLTCPECQRILARRQLSQQYDEFIFMDGGENLAIDFEESWR